MQVIEENQRNTYLLGLIGSFVWMLFLIVTTGLIVMNVLFRGDIQDFKTIIMLFCGIAILIGEIGLSNKLDSKGQILIGVFSLLLIYRVITFLVPSLASDIIGELTIFLGFILAIPPMILFALYWNRESLSKLLFFLHPFYVLLGFISAIIFKVIVEFDLYDVDILWDLRNGFLNLRDIFLIFYLLILGYWFLKLYRGDTSTYSRTSFSTPITREEKFHITSDRGVPSTYSPQGGLAVRGPPIMLFWCDSCNMQIKKGIKLKNLKEEEIVKPKVCPKCATQVRAWWATSTMNDYLIAVLGMSLMIGALITGLINNTFAVMGASAASINLVLIIVETIVGVGVMYYKRGQMTTVNHPPDHASTIAPVEPAKLFMPEAIKMGVILFVVGFIVFGINSTIIGILA
ncbi:MAG: hypothetical protein KAT16_00095 [Candidatus Heimdallarchaeota archaeon]|nr:hypothetical protein [Candidatus Heimdallarchaeota archaeon]